MSIITDFIRQLSHEGGSGNFLIINLQGNAYLQFAGEKNGEHIYCEACGNNPNIGLHLDNHQTQELEKLGWERPSEDAMHPNFTQNVHLHNEQSYQQLEQLIKDTARVYKTRPDAFEFELVLQ